MKLGVLDKRILKHIDWVLFANIMVLILLSFVAIASALSDPLAEGTSSISSAVSQLDLEYVFQQLTWLGVGLVAMFVLLLPDYHAIGEYYRWIYVALIVLLVAVYLFGSEINGTKGWFRIGSAGFQPSEVGKTGMVIVMARMMANRAKGQDGGIKRFRDILPILGVFALPVALILIQPDWGTALVYVFTFVSMLFMAKTSWKIIVSFLVAGGVAVPVAWAVMADWQKNRIRGFLGIEVAGMSEQDASDMTMQADRAQAAAGTGEITGKGLFSISGETQASRIPENHTDFIFASTTEAVGFVGAIVLLLLYFTLIIRTLYLATKAKDEFGKLIIIGVLAMTLFHIFENIGMNIGVMPITGIPLPFFSYGGSNLLTNMIAFGLVLNVSMRRQKWSI
ncbi:MAG: rod shape-determining protein RodA [Clostridia bacterium]|nr:rod shape-determining protein RodA [Clostridia bacterium]MBT7122017.1 rod shape-determining protein RodA [Clostridia bacterium]